MAYKMKLTKGNSALAEKDFYVGRIQNDRIMSKKEAYAYFVNEVGGKRADHAAAWKAFKEAIVRQLDKGNSVKVDGLGTFRILVKGGFDTSVGPWVKGKNLLVIDCLELAEFKDALIGETAANVVTGDTPSITSILDKTLEDYDVIRVGDEMSVAGKNLAPDPEAGDEYVAIFKGDELVKKATITLSELNTVEFKVEGVALEPGDYRIGVFTRCGDTAEGVSVKSCFRSIKVKG